MFRFTKIRSYLAAGLALTCLFAAVFFPDLAAARETNFFPDLPDGYAKADLTYGVADATRFYEVQEQVLLMNDIQNRNELAMALVRYSGEYQRLSACAQLAMYDYYGDPAAKAADYQAWQQLVVQVSRDYEATWQELLASDNRAMLEEMLSPGLIDQMEGAAADTAEMLTLKQQIQAVDDAYWRAVNADYQVAYQGKTYGFADLDNITDGDEYTAVYKQLAQARNRATAQLLADIVPVCNQYARLAGYADYADYAYAEIYGRDYTPAQAQELHRLVKQEIVPLYLRVQEILNVNPRFDRAGLITSHHFTADGLLDTVAAYMPEISDEYAELLRYMREKGLADIEQEDGRLNVSFTSYLPMYRLALIFSGTQNGGPGDLSTFIHEFGHFAFYMYEQRDCGYDVGEFHSQGLEALFLHFADDIFGEYGPVYRLIMLQSQLQSVVDGCMYDEFQQRLYKLENPTVSDLNRLFHEISLQYGYVYLHDDDEAYNWVTTAHTFIQPLYYISYATSGLTVCELLGRSGEDFTTAADSYLAMVGLRETGYTAFCAKAGFADVFTEAGMQKIADGLENYLYQEIFGLAELDAIRGHWAEQPLLYAVGLGILQGDEQGRLEPNNFAKRAEMVALLWRAYGSEQAEATGTFSDVAADAWYHPAVVWAETNGIISGIDGKLCPNDNLSREQAVAILYRLYCAETGAKPALASAALLQFADYSQVAPWSAEAFAWAAETGMITGNDKGGLEPKRAVTRAELASFIVRLRDLMDAA